MKRAHAGSTQLTLTKEIEMNSMPTIEAQYEEARNWCALFHAAGYETLIQYTPENGVFDREWQVWTAGGEGKQIATIDIDGCGASWHGPDDLWLRIIGPSAGVTA